MGMTKTELKQNITKIEQLLQSDKPEAGFELLKTINEPELNEALADVEDGSDEYFSIVSDIDSRDLSEELFPNHDEYSIV